MKHVLTYQDSDLTMVFSLNGTKQMFKIAFIESLKMPEIQLTSGSLFSSKPESFEANFKKGLICFFLSGSIMYLMGIASSLGFDGCMFLFLYSTNSALFLLVFILN